MQLERPLQGRRPDILESTPYQILEGVTCRIYPYVGSTEYVECQALKEIGFNLDLGVVFGYLKLANMGALHVISARSIHHEEEGMMPLTHLRHVYAGSQDIATKVLVIGDKTVYNVAVNRYRDSESIVFFIGQMKIVDIEKLKEVL